MTIRQRVTLWYSLVLLVAFIFAGGGMYYELVYERDAARQKHEQLDPMSEEVVEVLLCYILPLFAITVVGGWFLLRRSLKPLNQLTKAAERINAENLRAALPRTFNGDEVDRLSEVLNAMNQRLSAAMTEIHEFTLHASHELKTPLAILHTQIEMALASANSTADRERFADQLEEIQRLARIVEALNLLARSNSGQMQYVKTPLPLHAVVLDTSEDAATLARAQGISVKVDVGPETWIVGDRDRLRQMLLNLMENAIKYNERDGSVTVALRTAQRAATLEISNTGKGVSKKDLPHVFDKFYRGHRDRNGDPGGAGLGLSIVRSIVLAHGGEIKFESTVGGLTTVQIVLPTVEKPVNTECDASSAVAI